MNMICGIEKIQDKDVDITDIVISHFIDELQDRFKEPVVNLLNEFIILHSHNKIQQDNDRVEGFSNQWDNYSNVGSTVLSIRSQSKEIKDSIIFPKDVKLETAERILKIWDFCICFRKYFKLSVFKPTELYEALVLNNSETSPLLSHIFGGIIYTFLTESLSSNDMNITLMKRISQKDYYFIWPEILKIVLIKKKKMWKIEQDMIDRLDYCSSAEFNSCHSLEQKLDLLDLFISNYYDDKKFKEYIDQYYNDINGLEIPFMKEDMSMDEFDDISHNKSDLDSILSDSSSLYFNTYRRMHNYSLPLLLDKTMLSNNYISKYYYFYPDFPDMVLVRYAYKSPIPSLKEENENTIEYNQNNKFKPIIEESKGVDEETKELIAKENELKSNDSEIIEEVKQCQEKGKHFIKEDSKYEWRCTTDLLQLYINCFHQHSEYDHYVIYHSLLSKVNDNMDNQINKPEIQDLRDLEKEFNENCKENDDGLFNQMKYLKSLFDNMHDFLIQVLYPKLKMDLKEAAQEEKLSLYQGVMDSTNLRDFSKTFLQYIRKICFPKGVYYWKGIGMNKKIWGPRSTYVAAKEYIQDADTFTKVLSSVLILKNTLNLAFDS